MVFEFKLPDIGEGVHEGEIAKWLVHAGDAIHEDQPMVEVMTDKVTVEITSPVSGTIQKLLYKEGDVVKVGSVIIAIETSGAAAAPQAERQIEEEALAVAAKETPGHGGRNSATATAPRPAWRRLRYVSWRVAWALI